MRRLCTLLLVSVFCVLVTATLVIAKEANPKGRLLSGAIVDSGKLLLRFNDTSTFSKAKGNLKLRHILLVFQSFLFP